MNSQNINLVIIYDFVNNAVISLNQFSNSVVLNFRNFPSRIGLRF